MAELSDREAIKGVIPALTSQGIKPQILLNCAGIQRRHPSEKFPDEDWDEVRETTAGGPCLFSLSPLPQHSDGRDCA